MHKITKTAITLMLLGSVAVGAHAQGYSLQDVATFTGTDGANPQAGLTDVNGVLYGTSSNGGADFSGTLYSYTPGASSVSDLVDFTGGGGNGSNPTGDLTAVGSTLYGTTENGGASYDGTMFSYDTTTDVFNTLINFTPSAGPFAGATPGYEPSSGLTDLNGTLYGTTQGGGTDNAGTVFSYDLATADFTSTSFTGAVGSTPYAGLTYDQATGKFYGTTEVGNTLYSYDPTTNALTNLAAFTGTTGRNPLAGLTDVNGTLYGVTDNGGTLYSFDTTTDAITPLVSFTGPNGASAAANLTDIGGVLYGTTLYGGTKGDGTAFSYIPGAASVTTLASFGSGSEYTPQSDLTDVGGTLYGTAEGGILTSGEVYSLTPNVASAVPEPSPVALLLPALGGLLLLKARRKNGSA